MVASKVLVDFRVFKVCLHRDSKVFKEKLVYRVFKVLLVLVYRGNKELQDHKVRMVLRVH